MAVRFQLRRDTSTNWNTTNPILAEGEPGVELDTQKIKIGDGATAWNSLDYYNNSDFSAIENAPTTLAGYGITDAATSAQGSLADTAVQVETNDLTAAVTWANVPDAYITQSSVTQHQTALNITTSQITDFSGTTDQITEASNLYYTDARVDANFATKSTDDLSEGTNLYYTDARVDARLASGSVGNIVTVGYLAGPSTFTIDPATVGDNTGTVVIAGNLNANGAGEHSVGGNFTVAGNLTVNGTTTTINSTTLEVDDLNITLASGAADSSAANGAGLTVDGANASIVYTHATTSWDLNKSVNVTGDIAVSGTVDGVDIAARDAVLTSTTTTANSALQPADLGNITFTGNIIGTDDSTAISIAPSVTFDAAITVSDILPSADSVIDIGTSTNSFRSLHAETINTGNVGYLNARFHRIGPDSSYSNTLYPLSTASWSYTGFMDPGNIFHSNPNTYVRWKSTGQLVENQTTPAGPVEINFLASDTHYLYQPQASATTINFTNLPTTENRMYNMRVFIYQGATGVMPTTVQIDGTPLTIGPEWQNGIVPSPTPAGFDLVQFILWKVSGTWYCLAQSNSYT